MGGTKIFVLQMKDLIRTVVFAVLGLILIVLLVILFIPKDKTNPSAPSSLYIPGTYTSSIILNDKPLDVCVTVSEDEITDVRMTEMAEIQQVFYPLFGPVLQDLATDVLYYQSAEIVPVTDYPVTSGILQQAVVAALDRAKP